MRRFVRFNLVGIAGFGVQLGTLWLLLAVTVLPPEAAVALAVLLTVSHNFAWHERYTWPGPPARGRLRRWAAFNLSNGIVSLAVNVAITTPLAALTGLPIVAANVAGVLAASLVNFVVSDRMVFAKV